MAAGGRQIHDLLGDQRFGQEVPRASSALSEYVSDFRGALGN